METSHSLPTNSQRIATQLPFSPSGASFAAQRLQGQARSHSGSTSSATPHTRSGSIVSSRSRNQNPLSTAELFSPPPPLPLFTPRPAATTTTMTSPHASGIPPSAAFFHPLRPGQNSPTPPPFVRPSSPGSIVSSEAHGMLPVHIAPFVRQETQDTMYEESINMSSTEDLPQHAKSVKHSRDPLLPVSARGRGSTVTSQRPSISLSPYDKSETNVSAGARMRGSFEKLFKRGLSFDGGRKSLQGSPVQGPSGSGGGLAIDPAATCSISRSRQTSPVTPSAAGGHGGGLTFDLTTQDEEDDLPPSPLGPGPRSAAAGRNKLSPSMAQRRASSTSLPNLSFNPTRTDMVPPLQYIPRQDPKSGRALRNWQIHPSQNRFFFNGRGLTGGDSPWAFIASLTLVFGITGVWFGTTCVWWWMNESPAVAGVGTYMCLLTISSMCATAFRDPGILPRNLDPDPPSVSTGSDVSVRTPLPRDLKVRAGSVRVKYCPTCRTYRPPRSSHCKMCDNCVDGCDHHCQWVNNCVGRRNYTSFFTFLFSAVLTLLLVICTTAIHLWLLTRAGFGGLSFRQALATRQGTGSAVAFSIAILVVWPVSALLVYHTRLLLLNITTIEQIRNQAHRTLVPGPPPPNPFSHGTWRRNLLYVLCRPPGYSWLDFAGVATEDRREVNPGLLDGEEGQWRAREMEEGRVGKA